MIFNRLLQQLAALVDAGLAPWSSESGWLGVVLSGSVCALIVLGAFRWTTDFQRLEHWRNVFLARVLELVLYRHDLKINAQSYGRILRANAGYITCLLPPIGITTALLAPLLALSAGWFQWRPLRLDEIVVVDATLAAAYPVVATPIELQLSPGLELHSALVRVPSRNAILFRVRVTELCGDRLGFRVGEVDEWKSVDVGGRAMRVSPCRARAGGLMQWLNPAEPPLGSQSPFEQIRIQFPERVLALGGWDLSWLTAETLVIALVGLTLSKPCGVSLF